jgi:hypothetical protein
MVYTGVERSSGGGPEDTTRHGHAVAYPAPVPRTLSDPRVLARPARAMGKTRHVSGPRPSSVAPGVGRPALRGGSAAHAGTPLEPFKRFFTAEGRSNGLLTRYPLWFLETATALPPAHGGSPQLVVLNTTINIHRRL